MPTIYHVAKTGHDKNAGSAQSPFLTIGAAAARALPGDTVMVHAGEYREWVDPPRAGASDTRRITYTAAPGQRPVIKGSERVQSWQQVAGTVWKAVLPNSLFAEGNPYQKTVIGDWLEYRPGICHLGDVYLNGKSFYEAESYDALLSPETRTETLDHWTGTIVPIKDPEQTKYLWYCEVGDEDTTLFANFHGADPNAEVVEVNVRQSCFYPRRTGISYITVRGFEMAHAATPWAPPTGDQPGLLGAHWSRGWVIEDNLIHDSKCSAVSIGKEAATGDNYRTFRGDKPGYQYQIESVFAARQIGWSRESIGSHIVRNNTIYDCGQNAIVGHMGCAFSQVYGNHIYNVGIKREYYGHEIAGIKFHAPIDTHIRSNHIHDCSLGIWIDWQAQGLRISGNLLHSNCRDLFIEVSHGPHLIDHNILASSYALDDRAQGSAFVHNLFAGKILPEKVLDRATPYHARHSTEVAGYAMVYGGDNRFFENLFIGGTADAPVGTSVYNGATASLEEYIEAVRALGPMDISIFKKVEQPVYAAGNAYLAGAAAFEREDDKLVEAGFDPAFSIERADDGVYLNLTLPESFAEAARPARTTATLPKVRIVDAEFEAPDGGPLTLATDFFGADAPGGAVPGPIAALKPGQNRVKVWGAGW